MAYVSVGQFENLQEAIIGLCSVYDSIESACQNQIMKAQSKLDQAQKEADNSAKLLENAKEAENKSEARLQEANGNLNSAQRALCDCESSGSYDENGDYEAPSCSSEESDVSDAERAVDKAEQELEKTKEHRMQMENRNELARRILDMAKQLAETVRTECAQRLAGANAHIEIGKARLENAKAALNAYLDTRQPAKEFYLWLKWSPVSNKPIMPIDMRSRLNLSVEQLRYYFEYLVDRDPSFISKISGYRSQLEAAKGPAERHAVQLKIRRNLSGYCGEKIAQQALSPFGHKTDTQARTTFEDGRFTKTDIIIEDLRAPIVLGRGEGKGAPIGGCVALEVKCGRAPYLYSQKYHMVFQSGGHRKADASFTLCSRDIKDLMPQQEEELRKALREAGSPLIAMLPTKDEIDKACWDIVIGSNANKGGNLGN